MASTNNNPIFPQTIRNSFQIITHGDGTTIKPLFVAGVNGSIIESIIISSTDSSTTTVNLYITDTTGNNYYIVRVTNVSNSNPPINLFTVGQLAALANSSTILLNLDSNGNPYIYLAAGSSLSIGTTSTLTSTTTLNVVAQGGDY